MDEDEKIQTANHRKCCFFDAKWVLSLAMPGAMQDPHRLEFGTVFNNRMWWQDRYRDIDARRPQPRSRPS
jgi:hypothetical protein